MELQVLFVRRVGGAGIVPVLGTDAAPAGLPKIGSAADLKNIMRAVNSVVDGNPIQRVAVTYTYAGLGVAPQVPMDIYQYVRETDVWYKLGEQKLLTDGQVTEWDVVGGALPKVSTSPADPGDSLDSIEVVLIPDAPAGAPDGTYTFGAVFDLSSDGSTGATEATLLDCLTDLDIIEQAYGLPGPTGPAGAVMVAGTDGSSGLVRISASSLPTPYGAADGLDVATCAHPAGPWTTLRTFAGAIADAIDLTTLEVVTGTVDLTGYGWPGTLPGLTVTVNNQICQFIAGQPDTEAHLLTQLNAAMSDMTWTIAPGGAGHHHLVGTKKTPGNIALSGTALAVFGLTAATTGPWIAIPTSASYMPPASCVEIGFVPGFSVANAPVEVILRLWRMNALYGGTAEIAREMRIPAAEINTQQALRVPFDGCHAYLTVAFIGGTAPTITGTAKIRGVYDGTVPAQSRAWVRGGAKGATAAADVTSEDMGADRQALHVAAFSPAPGGWVTMRTCAGQVSEGETPPARCTRTGTFDWTAYGYPGAITGKVVTWTNPLGVVTSYTLGSPANMVALLVELNAAFLGKCTWTATGGGTIYLVVTSDEDGNNSIAGDFCTLAGITTGTWTTWTALIESKFVEVGYQGLSVTGAPSVVRLNIWRIDVNLRVDCIGTLCIPTVNLADTPTLRFPCDGSYIAATVLFDGGTAPTLTGVISSRPVHTASPPLQPDRLGQQLAAASKPVVLASDVTANTRPGGTAFLRTALGAPERYLTIKATPGTLNCGRVYNSGAPLLYLVLVDQVAAPTSAVTACYPLVEVPGNALVVYPFPETFAAGGHLCLSTVRDVYTDPGAVGYFAAWRD